MAIASFCAPGDIEALEGNQTNIGSCYGAVLIVYMSIKLEMGDHFPLVNDEDMRNKLLVGVVGTLTRLFWCLAPLTFKNGWLEDDFSFFLGGDLAPELPSLKLT